MQQKYCDHGRSRAVLNDYTPDLARVQFLRFGGKAEKRVDFAIGEQLQRVLC
jgi:hypothetical protein